ncbi:VOC family protein [Dinghuibacter silviterrae]|uniref:Putative enzyme related to lactoylglutathione lyase n=1 Tax=Dinghuibacter silviterrae TaxID=1539049 RepID=A0A4R8DF09_9BACT|nr:VOC family protein [Dinghuibacter silviterrae]TDW96163.1 putative enzyme related to lactoylglutathione lyase [Dinghuibacter silviterrae]
MIHPVRTFSSFSVDDLDKAQAFYGKTLGLPVNRNQMGLNIQLPDNDIFVYVKPNHEPATFTVLNFRVKDLEATVDALTALGVPFQHYTGPLQTNAKGIHSGGEDPTIAWFADPSGNILSVIQDNGA